MKRILFLISLFLILVLSVQAQKLSELPQQQRDSILLSVAKAAVLKYGPDYYRDYNTPGVPKPVIRASVAKKGEALATMYPELEGKKTYVVRFFYDKAKEKLLRDFAVIVVIVGDTGTPCTMAFGNNALRAVYDAEKKPQTRNVPTIPIVPYEQKPERPQTYNRADYPD